MEIPSEKSKVFIVVQLGVLLTLFIQMGVGIWWASATNTKLAFAVEQLNELKTSMSTQSGDRYRAGEAQRDFAARDARIEAGERERATLKASLEEFRLRQAADALTLTYRVTALEKQMDARGGK